MYVWNSESMNPFRKVLGAKKKEPGSEKEVLLAHGLHLITWSSDVVKSMATDDETDDVKSLSKKATPLESHV